MNCRLCGRLATTGDLCNRDYQAVRTAAIKAGTWKPLKRRPQGDELCDCGKEIHARGKCRVCYPRFLRMERAMGAPRVPRKSPDAAVSVWKKLARMKEVNDGLLVELALLRALMGVDL